MSQIKCSKRLEELRLPECCQKNGLYEVNDQKIIDNYSQILQKNLNQHSGNVFECSCCGSALISFIENQQTIQVAINRVKQTWVVAAF